MEPKRWWGFDVKHVAAVALVVAGVGVAVRLSQGEAGFARTFFVKLMNGNPAVEDAIDWEHLKAMEVDVGKTYTGLASDKERADYRNTFLASIAKGFQQTGARTADFVHWRVHERADHRTVIAADYAKKRRTILLSFSDAAEKKKLTGIQWVVPPTS